MTEVKNYIPSYPSPDDENLIINLTHLKEFAILQLQADEDIPTEKGEPLQSQQLESKYYSPNTPYAKGVLHHEVGTGKTCVASIIIERFKHTFVDGKPRKPALVIVRNSALRDAMRNEIANICTKDVYFAKLTETDMRKLDTEGMVTMTEEAKMRRLNVAISKTYEIVKYGDILDVKTGKAKSGKGMPSDETIIRDYSNRVIIIDEIQNIRQQPGGRSEGDDSTKPAKRKGKKSKVNEDEELEKDVEVQEEKEKSEKDDVIKQKKHRNRYDNLHKFLHLVENCRVLLLTGTPIWDKVYDIAGLFNLILPLNDQFPVLQKFTKEYFDSNNIIKPKKAKEFSRRIRGKVSYLRALISTAKRTEIGVTKPWLEHTIIFPSAMGDIQSKSVAEAVKRFENDSTAGSFYSDARDAANCTYPVINKTGDVVNGTYGVKAFTSMAITVHERKAYETSKKTGLTTERLIITRKFAFHDKRVKEQLGPAKGKDEYANLRRYNAKLASIIQMMRDPDRLEEKVLIFNDSVKGTGGVISTALILELWGFRWVKEGFKSITPKENTVERPGYFITITSEEGTIHEQAQIREVLAFCNNPNNIYGTTIRIIIGSEAISQGYTLKAIRQAHGMHGHWNLAFIDQFFGRTFRTGSHNQLPEKERYINIYRHVVVDEGKGKDAVTLPEGVSYPSGGTFSPKETIDTYIYKVAETKEFLDAQIYRLMKIESWNCSLTYKRNVLITDTHGSRECDYVECNYLCDGYDEKNIDKITKSKFINGKSVSKEQANVWNYPIDVATSDDSNYNLLYSDKDVKDYTSNIIELFHNYFALRYDMITLLLPYKPSVKFVLLTALGNIINKRIPVRNRYGIVSYLNEVNNIYYLDDYITEKSDYMSSVYTVFPLVNEFASLENVIESTKLLEDKPKVCDFTDNPTTQTFNMLSDRTQILLLEASLEKDRTGTLTKSEKVIYDFITTHLSKELFIMKDGNIVHNMYNTEYSGTSYNTASKNLEHNGRLRVYNIRSNKWNYVSTSKEEEYINEIKEKSNRKVAAPAISDNPYKIYGSSDAKNQKFKIHDDRQGKARAGRVCMEGGCKITYLYDVFHHLEHLPYDDEVSERFGGKSKNKLIEALLTTKNFNESPFVNEVDSMSTEKLEKLYSLFSMNKQELCNSLERFLKGDNPDNLNLYVET
jgi:hypothetical protein